MYNHVYIQSCKYICNCVCVRAGQDEAECSSEVMASTTDRTYSQPRRESGSDETESNRENRYRSVRDSLEHLYNISLPLRAVCGCSLHGCSLPG